MEGWLGTPLNLRKHEKLVGSEVRWHEPVGWTNHYRRRIHYLWRFSVPVSWWWRPYRQGG